MAFVLRPPEEVVPLNRRLRAIGRNRRLARVAGGTCLLTAALSFALAGLGALDAWLHLAAGLRALALLAVLALGGVLIVRGIRRPARESSEPVAVALLIESRYPEFNDLLASAATFQERTDDARSAVRFRRAAIGRAERMTDRHDLAGIVPTGRLGWLFAVATLACLALGTVIVADPGRAAVGAARLFDPFGGHVWPPKTRIEIIEPTRSTTLLARGRAFPIRFTVAGVTPAEAILSLRLSGSPGTEDRIPLLDNELPATEREFVLLPDRVTRDFEYRLVANDADTGWRSVSVAEPPRLTLLDGRPSPQIRLTYQPYTNEKPIDLPDGSGGIETISGTRLSLRAATDRRIVNAVLHYEGDRTPLRIANAIALLAGTNPLASAAAPQLGQSFDSDRPVTIGGPDGRLLTLDFEPTLSGLYALKFRDEIGLEGIQKLDVRTFPDPAPVVALLRPAQNQDPLLLVPGARVPVRVRADDRTYALARLWLDYQVNDDLPITIPLADVDRAERVLPAAVPLATGSRLRPQELESIRQIPLAAFRKRTGEPPVDGDRIRLRAYATDWDDYTLAKAPGQSEEVILRVLSEESMAVLLQKDLAALRPEIDRALKLQQDAAEKTRAAWQGEAPDEAKDRLSRAVRDQYLLRGILGDPREGTRAKAEKLRDIANANGLKGSPTARRAESVARILTELDDRILADIESGLTAGKRKLDEGTAESIREGKGALKDAEAFQSAAIEKLKAAAEELEQWAATAEVRGDARQLEDRVAQAASEAKALADRLPTGATPDRLPAADRAALDKLADGLQKTADNAAKLMSKADRVAAQRRADAAAAAAAAAAKGAEAKRAEADARAAAPGSPAQAAAEARAAAAKAESSALADSAAMARAEAEALEKAATDAGRSAIADDLRAAAESERKNRSGETAASLRNARERLAKIVAGLAEKRPDVDELAKKRKEAADRVDELADRQDELAKKARAAAEAEDGADRTAEMQRRAADQEALRRETEQLARKLEREGVPDAAEQLRRAAKEMEQARNDLAAGRDPGAKPDEALQRLEAAKDKLEENPPREQQLEREQREQLSGQFKTFVEKQKAAIEESERLTKAAVKARRWERPLQASLASLGEREAALAREIRRFADDRAKDWIVFDAMLRQAAERMDAAASRIAERKADVILADPTAFDEESETAADETARRPMRTALRRLEQIVGALNEDPKKNPPPKNGEANPPMPPMPPMPQAAGGGQQPPGVPPIAQLKALRDWQREVNDRTEAFAKAHPNRDQLTDDDKDDLLDIEQSQKNIAELLEEILPLLQMSEGGERP